MAVKQSQTAHAAIGVEPDESRTFDLHADFGLNVPEESVRVTASISGDESGFLIDVKRRHTWVIEGQYQTATVKEIQGPEGPVDKPKTVPGWVRRVLDHVDSVQIDQIKI